MDGIPIKRIPGTRVIDLTGETFGRLTVVKLTGRNKDREALWLCRCSCPDGTERLVRGVSLRNGNTRSCGCQGREVTAERNRAASTHGLADHALYDTWRNVRGRCYNQSREDYARYGARGREMHPEWRDDPAAFIAYAESLPHYGEEGRTLDRVNNDGHYKPGNLRWATAEEQCRNRGSNVLVTAWGRTRCVAEWAEITGLSRNTVYMRLRRGWEPERALSTGADPEVIAELQSDRAA